METNGLGRLRNEGRQALPDHPSDASCSSWGVLKNLGTMIVGSTT